MYGKLLSILLLLALSAATLASCDSISSSLPAGKPSSIDQAKYKVVTSARTFYTNSYTTAADGTPTLHGYFAYYGTWVWDGNDFEVSKQAWGTATVVVQGSAEDKDAYVYYTGGLIGGGWKTAQIRNVKQWQGTESMDLKFTVDKTPCIVNAWSTTTSKVASSFSVTVGFPSNIKGLPEDFYFTRMSPTGMSTVLIEEKRTVTIHVKASGVRWFVRVGVE